MEATSCPSIAFHGGARSRESAKVRGAAVPAG